MKIFNSEQIRKIDSETIRREGVPSLVLMKRASKAFFDRYIEFFPNKHTSIIVFAGVGNNGGDALGVARILNSSGYKVKVCCVEYSANYSEDCEHNLRRVKAENVSFKKIFNEKDIPEIEGYDVIIDGIFGTGLSREIVGVAAEVIKRINESEKPIISIDVPSGLFLDKKTTFAVRSTKTITFQVPKIALFLPDNKQYFGEVNIVPIGLNEDVIKETETNYYYIGTKEAASLLKPLSKFAHKGTQGHTLIIGGSLGKTGSVCLATKAALRVGCGLATAYVPKCSMVVIQSNVPEVMAIEDKNEEYLTSIKYDIKPKSIGIGIGMGQNKSTQKAFYEFLKNNSSPTVIDADALNILSQNSIWLSLLRANTILTPHPKELERLIGEWSDDFDKIQKTRLFAKKYNLIVVVKGANTLIIDEKNVYVNSSGSPALGTAGSGDVLTGMIAGLLAQGYSSLDAARIGVYLHGLTANLYQLNNHPLSLIAGDIIDYIGVAYRKLEKNS